MGILAWIVVGLIAGLVARWAMPGRVSGGIVITICLGIAGALLGGFISGLVFHVGVAFDLVGVVIAIGGAMLLLFLEDFLRRRRILR